MLYGGLGRCWAGMTTSIRLLRCAGSMQELVQNQKGHSSAAGMQVLGWCRCCAGRVESSQLTDACRDSQWLSVHEQQLIDGGPQSCMLLIDPQRQVLTMSAYALAVAAVRRPQMWHTQAWHTFTFVGICVQQCSKATRASSRCRRASSSAWAYMGAMLGLKP